MADKKSEGNSTGFHKIDDKDYIRHLLEGMVSEIEHVIGALAVADDGVVLEEVNVENSESIGAIAVFMGTIGIYIGETLHLGDMENGLVEFQGQKLIIVSRDIYYIGLLIDPKGSVKYIKNMVKDYLKTQS